MLKHNFLKFLLVAVLLLLPVQKAQASDVADNFMLVPLYLNGKEVQSMEIRTYENNDFALPVKKLAQILEIDYSYDKLNKTITFSDNSFINYKDQKAKINDQDIDFNHKIIHSKTLFDSDNPDDIFISVSLISKVLNSDIKVNQEEFCVKINSEKELILLNNVQDEKKQNIQDKEEKIVYEKIYPNGKKDFSLRTLDIQNTSSYYNSNQVNRTNTTSFTSMNNNLRTTLNGDLLKGNISLQNSFNMYDSSFNYSGVLAKYDRDLKKHKFEVGSISKTGFEEFNAGDRVLGVSFENIKEPKKSDDNNLVGVSNSKITPTLSSNSLIMLTDEKLESLGSKKLLLSGEDVEFSPEPGDKKTLKSKIQKSIKIDDFDYRFFAGVTGFNDSLFSNYSNFEYTKKFAGGALFSKELNDKTDLKVLILKDEIVSSLKNDRIPDFIPSQLRSSLLTFNSFKNFNNTDGQSIIVGSEYIRNDKFKLIPSFGLSSANNKSIDDLNPEGAGYALNIKSRYDGKFFKLNNEFFRYSPDFYLAGSSGWGSASSSTNDKSGLKTRFSHSNKYFSLSSSIENYISDLENRLGTGEIKHNDYNINCNFKLGKIGRFSTRINRRKAENNLGSAYNSHLSLNYAKNITQKLSGRVNLRQIKYGNENDSGNSDSTFKNALFSLNYSMPKRLGRLNLEKEFQNYSTNTVNQDNYTFNVGYSLPQIFGLIPSLKVGIPYYGSNEGYNYSVSLSYRFKTGRSLRLNYSYGRNFGYIWDDFYIPSSSRHRISLNLVDSLSLLGGIKSSNPSSKDSGFIKVHSFFDVNENGIKEPDEIFVPNVSFNIERFKDTLYTNKKGIYSTGAIPEGEYKIRLDKTKLPVYLVNLNNKNYVADVQKNKVTEVYFPLLSYPGFVSGKINITDELDNDVNIQDLIVCIYDESGKEINYTYVDEEMNFTFSNLKPGKYTINIDENYREEFCLNSLEENPGIVKVPAVFDEIYQIENIIVNYKQKDYI